MAKATDDDASLKRLGGGRWQTRDERFTIEPHSRRAAAVGWQLVPKTLSERNGGFLYVSSTQPLYGRQFFFTSDMRSLLAGPSGVLPIGARFEPPPGIQ